MKKFNIAKNILIASFLFFAQKIFAEVLYGINGVPSAENSVAYGMPMYLHDQPTFIEVLAKFIAPLAIVLLGAIVFPIVGFHWYAKRGGTKKWYVWLAFYFLFVAIAIVAGLAFRYMML
jgi:hypothetical protein